MRKQKICSLRGHLQKGAQKNCGEALQQHIFGLTLMHVHVFVLFRRELLEIEVEELSSLCPIWKSIA